MKIYNSIPIKPSIRKQPLGAKQPKRVIKELNNDSKRLDIKA